MASFRPTPKSGRCRRNSSGLRSGHGQFYGLPLKEELRLQLEARSDGGVFEGAVAERVLDGLRAVGPLRTTAIAALSMANEVSMRAPLLRTPGHQSGSRGTTSQYEVVSHGARADARGDVTTGMHALVHCLTHRSIKREAAATLLRNT